MSQLFSPTANQFFIQPVDTSSFTFNFLKMFLHFFSPFSLGFEVGFLRSSQHISRGDVQVHQCLPEGRTVPGLALPGLLHEDFEAIWAGGRDRKVEAVTAHSPNDG